MARETDGGLFRQLELIGARPLFAQPVNLAEWEYKLTHDQTELVLHPAADGDALQKRLEKIGFLPLVVKRGNARKLFKGLDELELGDQVMALNALT